MTLRVYNYAQASARTLSGAERKANRLFERAVIETAWRDCPTSPEEVAINRACAEQPGPNHLVLNLLPNSMSKKYGFKRGIFGFALPTATGRPGSKISLFYGRVLDLAYHGGVGSSFEDAQAIILAYMMAHEVGHLLLGPDSHAPNGLMSFPWTKRTLTNIERDRLEFSPEESRAMRSELLRRENLSPTKGR